MNSEELENNNPIQHFQQWFHEVDQAYPQEETNAMILSTIGQDGFPKSRIVLLKRFTWEGFVFFTNYQSDKGKAIAADPRVSLFFNWPLSNREVRINGMAEKIVKNLSEGYFETRPDGSKLGAWASKQSEVVASRQVLEDQLMTYESKFKGREIPMPDYWGGYIVKPKQMEFMIKDPVDKCTVITSYSLDADYDWVRTMRYEYPES